MVIFFWRNAVIAVLYFYSRNTDKLPNCRIVKMIYANNVIVLHLHVIHIVQSFLNVVIEPQPPPVINHGSNVFNIEATVDRILGSK